ncbi:MAG: DUF6134 family protein [Geminicoccaceae bacterium]|nr:DUF6134 family protein [Geminicoccaceae bacterium]MCX8101494.1 DUF6134 family protein [Geminicoccaceae bacterium]MDW8371066.1 DUF6134 family protein [Geminicoccaceae bacterium]
MSAAAVPAAVGRRFLLTGLASLGLLRATGARASTPPEDRAFAILRKDEEIGRHIVTFAASAKGLTVRHDIDVTVTLAFVPLYRYRQAGEDLWREGKLVASDVETDDNGERTSVRIRERAGRLACEGPRGVVEAALGTMTDLSYWNVAILRQRRLIDSQLGELAPLAMGGGVLETIEVRGRPITARRWQMNPEGSRGGEVWYDEAGRIVKAIVRTRGEVLDYRLL